MFFQKINLEILFLQKTTILRVSDGIGGQTVLEYSFEKKKIHHFKFKFHRVRKRKRGFRNGWDSVVGICLKSKVDSYINF